MSASSRSRVRTTSGDDRDRAPERGRQVGAAPQEPGQGRQPRDGQAGFARCAVEQPRVARRPRGVGTHQQRHRMAARGQRTARLERLQAVGPFEREADVCQIKDAHSRSDSWRSHYSRRRRADLVEACPIDDVPPRQSGQRPWHHDERIVGDARGFQLLPVHHAGAKLRHHRRRSTSRRRPAPPWSATTSGAPTPRRSAGPPGPR